MEKLDGVESLCDAVCELLRDYMSIREAWERLGGSYEEVGAVFQRLLAAGEIVAVPDASRNPHCVAYSLDLPAPCQ